MRAADGVIIQMMSCWVKSTMSVSPRLKYVNSCCFWLFVPWPHELEMTVIWQRRWFVMFLSLRRSFQVTELNLLVSFNGQRKMIHYVFLQRSFYGAVPAYCLLAWIMAFKVFPFHVNWRRVWIINFSWRHIGSRSSVRVPTQSIVLINDKLRRQVILIWITWVCRSRGQILSGPSQCIRCSRAGGRAVYCRPERTTRGHHGSEERVSFLFPWSKAWGKLELRAGLSVRDHDSGGSWRHIGKVCPSKNKIR